VIVSEKAREASVEEWARHPKASVRNRSGPRGNSALTVLVVDDNERYRSDLVEFLQKQKWTGLVRVARSGEEAIALTRTVAPDLVLIDVNMPGMSGFESTRQIKNLFPHTKVVFTTIHEKFTTEVLSEYLNADGFVCKSSAKSEIPRVLRRLGFEIQPRTHRAEK
jgi:DNA-binding NarL/FixJ family response regulator